MSDSAHPAPRPTSFPVRIFRIGDEPGDDLSTQSTAEERLEMVEVISARMWELMGVPPPAYSRENMPVRMVRR